MPSTAPTKTPQEQAFVTQAGDQRRGDKGIQCVSNSDAWMLLINASRFSGSELSLANTHQLGTGGWQRGV